MRQTPRMYCTNILAKRKRKILRENNPSPIFNNYICNFSVLGASRICFREIWRGGSEDQRGKRIRGPESKRILVSGRKHPEISELTVSGIISFCMAFDKAKESRVGRNNPLHSMPYKESEDEATKNIGGRVICNNLPISRASARDIFISNY